MFQTDHIKLTAILRITIGWKTNPKQYGSVLIMRKPIYRFGNKFEKNRADRIVHTPSFDRCT